MSVSIDGAGSIIGVDQGLNIVGITTITHAEVTTAQFTGSYVNVDGNLDIADSIRHLGDSNTKIRFPAADTFTVETAGNEAIRVDSSGRIIIGKTSSIASLADSKIEAVSGAGAEIHLARNDSSVTEGNAIGILRFYGNDGGTYQECARINCQADGTHADGDKPSRLTFYTTPSGAQTSTERLRITSAGRIGINATSPGSMLQVDYDEGSSEVGLRLRAYNASGSKTWQLSEVNGNAGVFTIRNATNSQNNLSIDGSSGYVGVNNTSPDRRLEVVETVSSLTYPVAVSNFTNASAGVGAAIDFRLTTGGNTRGELGLVYAGNNNSDGTDFVFKPNDGSTGNIERMRIEGSSGNIGIGTDNPGEPLHVFVGNGGNGEPIALFEHDHGSGGDASIRIEGGASGNPDEVYLELCDKDDSANSFTMGMNDDITRLRFEYGARGANNGRQLLTLDQFGAARFNGASGVLRDPTIDNTSYVGLSLWPSGTGGPNYSDNHNISFTQEDGNWMDGHSNSTKSSFGMVFNYTSDGNTMATRGGIHYDHRGAERFKFWSSYGDISFKTDSGASGNETWTTCDKEGLRITRSGHVLKPTMAAAAVTLSAGQTNLTTFNTTYQTLPLDSEGYDNANNFNTSNYRFTAPETGFYQVGCNVQLENASRSASGNRWMYLFPIINGASGPSTSTGGNNSDFDPGDTYYYTWTYTTLLKLSQNDYVEWKYRGNLDSVNLKGGVETIFYFYQVG